MVLALSIAMILVAWRSPAASAHGVLSVPTEYPTLTDALDAAHHNDIIFIQPGVYVEEERIYPGDGLTAGPILDSLTNLTIVGAVAGEVIIDLGDHHHGFAIIGTSAIINIQGITFRGNGASLLSALDSAAGLSLINCTFECGPSVTSALQTTLGGHQARKCTFAGAGSGSAITTGAGGNTLKNSIVAGFDRLTFDPAQIAVGYTCFHNVGGPLPAGAGVFSADPLFADPAAGDFHLRSVRGRWDVVLRTFVSDPVSSPCIDAGDPVDSVIAETWPHGSRVNLGAIAATQTASRSPAACAFDLCGDCDGDGVIGILDSLLAAQIGVALVPGPQQGTNPFDSCNVQGLTMPDPAADIGILDSLEIARFAAGATGILRCCP